MRRISINRKQAIIALPIMALVLFSVVLINFKSTHNASKIDKVLNTKYYSYLPDEAKEYIKEAYERTGNILLTEKNKQENVPYLNPDYVTYLTLSKKEKEKVELIPETTKLDYIFQNEEASNLPAKYDLRNVNGKTFITPLKDQGDLGLCWAFASVETAESYIMMDFGMSYSDNTEVFSVRQMDYATSYDGIRNYNNENAYRALTGGGNFYMSSFIMANGLSLTYDRDMPYNQSKDKKDLVDVLNYDNTRYILESSVMVPSLDDDYTEEELTEYVNIIKDYIRHDGGAYVGTGSPQAYCGSKNTDGKIIVVDEKRCHRSINYGGHAMQIIGWDDDYEYSYCATGNIHHDINSDGTCPDGGKTSGKGAWIVRNSWGPVDDYAYIYLGYNSIYATIDFIDDLEDIYTKTWNNNYHENLWTDGTDSAQSDTTTFKKKIPGREKLEKVKFLATAIDGSYQINVKSGSVNETFTATSDFPGVLTAEPKKDIYLDEEEFTVTVTSNSEYLLTKTISVFTSNVESDPIIKTEDIEQTVILSGDNDFNLSVYSDTKNISSNEPISYSLYKNGENYSQYLTVSKNKVAENNVNANIIIDRDAGFGEFTLKTKYNNKSFSSKITLNGAVFAEGDGTYDEPYIIHDEQELKAMAYDLTANYKLANDIELSQNWIPIGTEETPFSGGLNGDYHTIRGLKVTGDNLYGGLFGYVQGYDKAKSKFENINIENPDVSGKSAVGALMGVGYPSYVSKVNIYGGKINSSTGNAGALIGSAYYNQKTNLNLYDIFSSASIYGTNSAGIIGEVSEKNYINIWRMQNVGMIYANEHNSQDFRGGHSSIIGNISNIDNTSLFMYSSFFTDYIIDGDNYRGDLLNVTLTHSDVVSRVATCIYYIKTDNDILDFSTMTAPPSALDFTNVSSATELLNSALYTSCSDINNKYEQKTVDGIIRIPTLKTANMEYTSIADVSVNKGETISLLDYITPTTDAIKIKFKNNSDKIKVSYTYEGDNKYPSDIKIEGLKRGQASLQVSSDYDGYQNDIIVNVISDEEFSSITFDSNGGTGSMDSQEIGENETVNLNDNKFTKEGYKFTKWNTKADGTGTSYNDKAEITTSSDLTLYAQWAPITYSVIFNSNGGQGSMDKQDMVYDQEYNLRDNTFTKENHLFKEWNTKSDGSGTSYSDKAQVSNITNKEGNITLYAIWKDISRIKYTSSDFEGIEDGEYHTINLSVQEDGYNIVYSVDGTNYNLNQIPSFNTVGEHIVYYKITKDGYPDVVDSNKVKIYGITNMDASLRVVNTDFLTIKNDNSFVSVSNKISNYSKSYEFTHYNNSNKEIFDDLLKTGDVLVLNINEQLNYRYKIAILGDINGDGEIDSADLLKIRQHLLRAKTLTGANEIASDINFDSAIDSADLLRVRQHLIGVKLIA